MAIQYDEDLRSSIEVNMNKFRRIPANRPELKAASVALCIVDRSGLACLLITKRAATMRSHAGQWALPGGRREPHESIEQTAVRELLEETGLKVTQADVLGTMDDYATRSGYVMTPVIIWGGADKRPSGIVSSEVAEIHAVPLAELDVEPRFLRIPESESPVIQLPLFGRYIHAPTAALIYQFCQVALHGQVVRVRHFEQPVFAWR
jgi:8-oxo-dGTP pyrophosphatase MutT (NUDIX family)